MSWLCPKCSIAVPVTQSFFFIGAIFFWLQMAGRELCPAHF